MRINVAHNIEEQIARLGDRLSDITTVTAKALNDTAFAVRFARPGDRDGCQFDVWRGDEEGDGAEAPRLLVRGAEEGAPGGEQRLPAAGRLAHAQ